MIATLQAKGTVAAIRFFNDRRAIESSEIAIVMAAVVVVVIGAFRLLGGNIADVVNQVAGAV